MEIVYPRACGVDVHKSFIVAVICISESIKPRYIKKRFSTFNNQLIQFRDWLIETTVTMYAWNPLASTIFLYTMHWKVTSPMSLLPILNGSRLSKVRRMTIRMPNGLPISLSSASSDPAIFPKRIFVSSGNLPAISISLSISVLLRRIVSRTL